MDLSDVMCLCVDEVNSSFPQFSRDSWTLCYCCLCFCFWCVDGNLQIVVCFFFV